MGVGSNAETCCSRPGGDEQPPNLLERIAFSLLRFEPAVGVWSCAGDEESGPLMRRPDIRSSNNIPACRHPEGGKVSEDLVESESKVPCDVLQDDEPWS